MRDLDVRREGGEHQGDGVALLEQPVVDERVEDVAHRRRPALDGEEIEAPLGRAAAAQLLHEVVVDDLLAVHEHPIGHRVVVPDDRVRELVHPRVGVEAALLPVLVDLAEEVRPGGVAVRDEEPLQPIPDPRPVGHPGEDALVAGAPALPDRERPEQEVRLAGLGGDPVRIAAAGVEHHHGALLLVGLGEPDEVVLELERRELAERPLPGAAGLESGCEYGHDVSLLSRRGGPRPYRISSTMTIPQMMRRVLLIAYGIV